MCLSMPGLWNNNHFLLVVYGGTVKKMDFVTGVNQAD